MGALPPPHITAPGRGIGSHSPGEADVRFRRNMAGSGGVAAMCAGRLRGSPGEPPLLNVNVGLGWGFQGLGAFWG